MNSVNQFYRRYGKRAGDLLAAAALLVVLAPLVALLAIAVAALLGRPVLFTQRRPGWRGKPFRLVKFRTMNDARDDAGELAPDEVRLTRFGRWLRATSLDELPELWNVLRGEMSLVGPRPLLCEYLPLYSAEQARRHEVRPGLTGLAQVNGRNEATWEQQFALDVDYVARVSLTVDLRILAATATAALARRGISQPGRATRDKFTGSRPTENRAAA